MNLISRVAKEDYSDYVLYFVENLSDELKQEIRNRLVAVCHGADQAQSTLKIYSYKETVNPIMFAGKISTVVNSTSCNDCNITIIPNIEIIVHHFFQSALAKHYRNMHTFIFCSVLNDNVYSRFVFFGNNVNIGCCISSGRFSIPFTSTFVSKNSRQASRNSTPTLSFDSRKNTFNSS